MSKAITKMRKIYKDSYILLRRLHLKRVVSRDKRAHTGAWVLTKEQERAAKDFFRDYRPIDLLYHNFYTEKRGEFSAEYLPDDLYYGYVDMAYNDHQAALVFDNKCLYPRLFSGVKQPKTVCRRQNGFWFLGDGTVTVSQEDALQAVLSHKVCFIKRAVDCGGGVGVWHFDTEEKDREALSSLVDAVKEDLIVQEAVKQHEALARLNPSSVNTIRSVSYLGDGGVRIYANVLRMGSNGAKVDNISSGGLTVNIEDGGALSKTAYKANGDAAAVHPDTGVAFESYPLPSFAKLQEQVRALHLQIPQFRLVSWDFTVDEEGEPILIEANMSSGGINVVQLAHGPLFGKDTRARLDEVFGR